MFFLIGGIFLKFWGQLGANVFVEFENVFFSLGSIGGKFGQLGTNVLVEFKNVFLIGGYWAQMC